MRTQNKVSDRFQSVQLRLWLKRNRKIMEQTNGRRAITTNDYGMVQSFNQIDHLIFCELQMKLIRLKLEFHSVSEPMRCIKEGNRCNVCIYQQWNSCLLSVVFFLAISKTKTSAHSLCQNRTAAWLCLELESTVLSSWDNYRICFDWYLMGVVMN